MKVKTSKTKSTNQSKQPRLIQKISLGILLFGLTFLMYFGYCWGWWGRNSLFLQLIFQCGCPSSSNEFRYPDEVDVVIPACKYDEITMSPSGKTLYVNKKVVGKDVSYFWNLQTDEKFPFTIPDGSKYFLTDDVLFLRLDYGKGHEGGEYILDRVTGQQYPIQEFFFWSSNAKNNGEIDLDFLIKSLRGARDIFLLNNDTVVALNENFAVHPELNFIVSAYFPGREVERVEKFLQQNSITYSYVPYGYSHETMSPDSRFIARPDGVYLAETEQKIVEGFSSTGEFRPHSGRYFLVIGWMYDGSGVIYSKLGDICLIEISLYDGAGCFIKVPQPVLKLKVPQEYLIPVQ